MLKTEKNFMQTLILEKPGEFSTGQRPQPGRPGPGEALVRVHRIGVCGTDLHAYRGKQPFFEYPRVLGHELGVEVVEVGAGVTNISAGDRGAVEPYLNCGICIACRRHRPNCCTRLKVLGVHTDGGHTTHLLLPAIKVHRSATLSFEQLALVETLGIGAHAVNRAALETGENVLVIGAGPIGLAVLQFAMAAGARVLVMDGNTRRLDFCRGQFGVTDLITAGLDAAENIKQATNGDMPTAVFDATGNADSMREAFGLIAHGGRLVFVGLYQGTVTFNDPDFHRRETTLLGSRNSTPDDFRRIIGQVERKEIDTGPWITHRCTLDEAPAQFPHWLSPESGVIKAMIEIDHK